MFRRLGSWCHDRRRLVLVLWIAALFLGNGIAGRIGDAYRQDFLLPGLESTDGFALVKSGDRNWWLPHWVDRLLPNLDVEGHATRTPPMDDRAEPDAVPQPERVPMSAGTE